MSICALGIMGTRYIRSNALPTSLEVTEGTVTTLNVQQIVSEYDIGNVLEVNLAAPALSFVQIVTQDVTQAELAIDATSLTAGEVHVLELISRDTALGSSGAILKTDYITITVVNAVSEPPTSADDC